MRIDYLYRFPVKGLSAEALDSAEVEPGGAIPWDRAFALAQGDSGFDPEQPQWRPKHNFMCLKQNPRVAGLRAFFEPRTGLLSLRAPDGSAIAENALTASGRDRIGAFLIGFMGSDARPTPRFHYVPGHVFSDSPARVVSLIGLSSLRDLETRVGARRHRRRFRANVWFNGAAPFAEFDWVGRQVQLGGATVRVLRRIPRCPATQVNPMTAERDADPTAELREHYGHGDLGVYAEVVEGGRFSVGDAIELLPE